MPTSNSLQEEALNRQMFQMKAIMLTKDFPTGEEDITITGGPPYYFYNMSRFLDRSDIRVVIICKNENQGTEVEQKRRTTIYRIDPRRYFADSLSLIRRLSDSNTIILTDGQAYTFVFGLLAKLLHLRHVAIFHDCRISYYISRALAGHFSLRDFLGILLTYASVLINPDLVLTVSETSKAELIKAGFKPSKIFVIYNGIYLDNVRPQEKQNLIVQIGLAPWKNLSMVIEAMPYVLSRVPTAQLYVVGPGDIGIYLEKVAKLKLADRVRFFGLIPEHEKQDILSKSKVLTLVSSIEGFGIPILEAWKHDAAPVLSRLKVFKEIAVDGENCIMTGFSAEQIADSIVLLLQNEETRTRLCKNGKKTISERFSLESVFKRFKEAIDYVATTESA